MKGRIIGLTGRARHGKDTIGAYLVDHYGYKRISFADPLKELVYKVNPFIPVGEDQEGYIWSRYQAAVDDYGMEEAKGIAEVRRLLQETGTKAREVLGADVWVDAAMRKLPAYNTGKAVFTDVRFPNEADAIRDAGGVLVRVVRPGFNNGVDPFHPSESQVDDLGHDATVYNDGTLEELPEKFEAALKKKLGVYLSGRRSVSDQLVEGVPIELVERGPGA